MYRPPENSNRVKLIRSKFEQTNLNNETNNMRNQGLLYRSDKTDIAIVMQRPKLTQQLSDPHKRNNNIKRTPAFRLDRTTAFQRSNSYNKSANNKTINQFSNSCDSNNVRNATSNEKTEIDVKTPPVPCNTRPPLIKSKSSHDFAYLRSKFDNKPKDVNLLYTEPIPKSLRIKETAKEDIYNANTLRIAHDIDDKDATVFKRPLPNGPPPKKPPRTFEHSNSPKIIEKNHSALHKPKDSNNDKAKPSTKSRDPRYMLNKLEMALRTNKMNKSKPVKIDISTTSGEDSDDSLLFRSKSSRNFSRLPRTPKDSSPDHSNSFNFNCLHGITCTNPRYEQIKQPTSSFFVSCDKQEEPVYAEPFEFPARNSTGDEKRNSLYYMSTPLLCDAVNPHHLHSDALTLKKTSDRIDNDAAVNPAGSKLRGQQTVMSAENSSLSSFTSDLDSAASTPGEERKNVENSFKIKKLIDTFENKPNRVDDLKTSIQKTLDRCFSNDATSDEDTSKSTVDMMINKFQSYVKTMPKYRKCRLRDGLFYCCLIVGWDLDAPKIKFKFPKDVEIPHKIEELCYPEAASGPLDRSNNAQCYSLVITNDKGERTFGYCRRVIPEGCTNCLPLAYCILSKHRSPRFYKKILEELESRHGIPDKLREELISEFFCNKFPKPGQSIRIDLSNITKSMDQSKSNLRRERNGDATLDLTSYVLVNQSGGYGTLNLLKKNKNGDFCEPSSVISEINEKSELILTLHSDVRYEDADLRPIHQLPSQILLKVFASLLLERKVILISCVLSKLSACVDALQSILYPFSWPHTFIPILPQCLWDVVESPTPVVCGVLSVAVVNEYKIEHGIVVDLDEGCILSEEGDEDSILCNSMKKAWEKGMELANSIPPNDYGHSVYLSDAYIKVFTHSLKNYKSFIVNGNFQKEDFIRNGKTKGVRRFLKWFAETTLFTSFIDSVLADPQSFTLFDRKMEIYSSDDSDLILSKLLEWKK